MFLSDMYERLEELDECLGIVKPITLKELCLSYTNDGEGLTLESIVHQSAPKVFSFDFPIFDENHRLTLLEMIIKRYYFRRLCCEDVDEWKLRMDSRLNEIMPYYNKMYESLGYLVDIMDDVDYKREVGEDTSKANSERTKSTQESINKSVSQTTQNDNFSGSRDESRNTEVSESATENGHTQEANSNTVLSKFSDTPQGELEGLVAGTYVSSATHAETNALGTTDTQNDRETERSEDTTATENTNSNRSTARTGGVEDTGSVNGSFDTDGMEQGQRNMTEYVKGKMYGGSKSKYVLEYRKAVMNVDVEIIGRLADLFMQVY